MRDAPLPDLVLYGRPGCHLCDQAREMVDALLGQRAEAGQANPNLVERDIETDDDWQRAYFTTIPVLEIGDHRLELATSMAKIRRLFADALD
jgi:glutaredoxin